ncbi:MAG: glycosyltransferase [Chitinivibrionales bacterium]|nr:glycosyltransferase [Chitinivibrionales bacterium]MBD3395625.1 glycosyltransferase [Chitinivibrionales bacterium]
MNSPAISIVAPVYNSRECLEELARHVKDVCSANNISWELILVNDCSTDDSWSIIRKLCSSSSSIRGLNLRRNFGQDNAIMAGIHCASGLYVVIMDDDLQHDPADIPSLLEEIRRGYDVVYATYRRKRQRLWKNIGSWFNGKVATILLRKPEAVYLSPYKILTSDIATEIGRYDGPYPYIDGLLFRSTCRYSEVPVKHADRFKGRTTYTLLKSIKVWTRLVTTFSVFPLRLATVIGFVTAISGIALGFYFMLIRLTQPDIPIGWASTTVSVLVLSGIQLFAIGVVGEYIGRAYLNLNRHPQYAVGEAVGIDKPQ